MSFNEEMKQDPLWLRRYRLVWFVIWVGIIAYCLLPFDHSSLSSILFLFMAASLSITCIISGIMSQNIRSHVETYHEDKRKEWGGQFLSFTTFRDFSVNDKDFDDNGLKILKRDLKALLLFGLIQLVGCVGLIFFCTP